MQHDEKNLSGRPDKKRRGPDKGEMRKAAEEIGLSRHEMYQYIAISNIPDDEFEALLSREKKVTTTELARIGANRKERPKARPIDRLKRLWTTLSEEEQRGFLEWVYSD